MTVPLESEIPPADTLAHLVEQAAHDAVALYVQAEHAEEAKLAKLMTKLDLCVFIPATILVIAVIVWLKLEMGPEVGMLTLPTGYAVLRVIIAKKI